MQKNKNKKGLIKAAMVWPNKLKGEPQNSGRKGEEPSRDGKWAVGTQDSGSSSRQPRADFRGRKSLPGITLFMLCAPLVKLVTVSTRLFPSQLKKKKKKDGLLRVENPMNSYEKAS